MDLADDPRAPEVQGIVTRRSRGSGFRSVRRVGRSRVAHRRSDRWPPSRDCSRKRWHFVAGTFDAASGEATVEWRLLDVRQHIEHRSGDDRSTTSLRRTLPLLIGADAVLDPRRIGASGCFNGKIESPRLFTRGLTDDELDALADDGDPDRAPRTRRRLGLRRVVTHLVGRRRHRAERARRGDPQLPDARTHRPPLGRHGIPARRCPRPVRCDPLPCRRLRRQPMGRPTSSSRCRPGCAAGTTPPTSRAPASTTMCRSSSLLRRARQPRTSPSWPRPPPISPTPTSDCSPVPADDDFSGLTNIPIVLDPLDEFLGEHREYGGSIYDVHTDGSGVSYSSSRRPLVSMRATHRHWVTGCPAGLCLRPLCHRLARA